MTTLSIKDVPEQWAEALRQRAARNHRSLQGELMALIEQAATGGAEPSSQNAAPGTPRRPAGFVRPGSKTIEQIYAEHLERFPTPFTEGPMSVDIIRQDRDSR
jgi:plasmid stability protein